MMSKAAYMMQDHLRRNYILLTDIHNPNVFVVRGRLPFPQGLSALANHFRGCVAADVYSHPYFIEKQSDPSQPSPQLHLTEECQSVMKVIKGLHFMKDDSSKLDNTMVVVTDYSVAARGRMLSLTTADDDAAADADRQQRQNETEDEWRRRLTRGRWRRSAAGQREAREPHAPQLSYSPVSTRADVSGRLVERVGGHTTLYNPVHTDPHSFAATLRRLHDEERVVQSIVVPTRQAWGAVRDWVDAFPDANILCSGDAPTNAVGSLPRAHASRPHVGGCVDLGGGVTGMAFPDAEEEEEVHTDGDKKHSDAYGKSKDPTRSTMDWRDAFSHHTLSSGGLAVGDDLRLSPRLRPLGRVDHHSITPSVELIRVAGDDQTNEYVLYDKNSGSLACTDLFHGEYGDLDPLNTWMCRVWFKFMKEGNYKRIDVVPKFKWQHVCDNGDLKALRETVDMISKTRSIHYLLYAHGTPPRTEDPANVLRFQWGLPPLTMDQSSKIK